MADNVVVKEVPRPIHEEGQYVALCVDCVDLGEYVVDYPNQDKYLAQKCALVFRTGETNEETGEPIDISQDFAVSMSDRGNLRKFLESWRGKKYTDEQRREGVPLAKLVGQHALLSIVHKESKQGRKYAVILSASPVPKQLKDALPEFTAYVRAPYWVDRKKANVDAATKFRAESAPHSQHDSPLDDEPENDLPF